MDHSEIVLREKLKRFAAELRLLSVPTSPITVDVAMLVAGAFEQYLNGKARSLDKAFGFAPKKGRPTNADIRRRHIAKVRMIDDLRAQGAGWEGDSPDGPIPKALADAGFHISDVRELRRLYRKWRPKLRVRKILQELATREDEGHPVVIPAVKGDKSD